MRAKMNELREKKKAHEAAEISENPTKRAKLSREKADAERHRDEELRRRQEQEQELQQQEEANDLEALFGFAEEVEKTPTVTVQPSHDKLSKEEEETGEKVDEEANKISDIADSLYNDSSSKTVDVDQVAAEARVGRMMLLASGNSGKIDGVMSGVDSLLEETRDNEGIEAEIDIVKAMKDKRKAERKRRKEEKRAREGGWRRKFT